MAIKNNQLIYRLSLGIKSRIHWISLLLLVLIVIGPLLWTFFSSFKAVFEVYKTPPKLLPERFLPDAYIHVIEYPHFLRIAFNSLFLATVSSITILVLSVLAGYGFARYKFPFKKIFLLAILVPRILPRVALIIPLFSLFAALKVLNTYIPLFLTYVASGIPFATWVLTAFFSALPEEIEDAAAVDGVTKIQMLRQIIVPLSAPAMVTAGIISFVTTWQEFPFALSFVTSTKMRTLPFQLFVIKDSIGIQNWPVVLAFTILTIIPVLILYMIFTRRVLAGIVSGAIK